jgi:hypothetical protein
MTNEMGGACGAHGTQETCMLGFGDENLNEREHLEELCIEGWIILKLIFKK